MKSKKALVPLVIASSLALLFGLSVVTVALFNLFLDNAGLRPLPDEQRYSRIDSVKNKIDFSLAGEISREDYSGDGVWSGSIYTVEVKGIDSFHNLKVQLEKVVTNCTFSETQFNCISENNPSIRLTRGNESATLVLVDSLGGRDAER